MNRFCLVHRFLVQHPAQMIHKDKNQSVALSVRATRNFSFVDAQAKTISSLASLPMLAKIPGNRDLNRNRKMGATNDPICGYCFDFV